MNTKKQKTAMPMELQQLYDQLTGGLEEIKEEYPDVLVWTTVSMRLVADLIKQLQDYATGAAFTSESSEIVFFKEIKPLFYSELIFFTKLYNFEIKKPTGSVAVQKEYLFKCLQNLFLDFENHRDFYQYCRSGATYMDQYYFLRGPQNMQHRLQLSYMDADPKFSTGYDFMVAKLLASERLSDYLNERVTRLEENTLVAEKQLAGDKNIFAWNAQVVYLVELIYALHSFDPFKDERVNVTNLTHYFSLVFNISIGSVHKKFEEIRLRKKNRTVFLDLLKQALTKQMEQDDEKAPRK